MFFIVPTNGYNPSRLLMELDKLMRRWAEYLHSQCLGTQDHQRRRSIPRYHLAAPVVDSWALALRVLPCGSAVLVGGSPKTERE